ncbi:MAG: HEAT repeat domain-containing protein [Vulcanimicrobiota bacterium]
MATSLKHHLLHTLARLGDDEALAVLQQHLEHESLSERRDALEALFHLHRDRGLSIVELLSHAMRDRRAEVRLLAVQLARQAQDPALTQALAERSADRSEEVFEEASRALRELQSQDEQALAPLLETLRSHAEWEHRLRAAQALAYRHSMTPAIEALLMAVQDSQLPVRITAGQSLSYLPVADQLVRLLDATDGDIQLSVLWALTRHAQSQHIPLLEGYLDHPDIGFRKAAVVGLGQAQAAASRERLRKMWKELD